MTCFASQQRVKVLSLVFGERVGRNQHTPPTARNTVMMAKSGISLFFTLLQKNSCCIKDIFAKLLLLLLLLICRPAEVLFLVVSKVQLTKVVIAVIAVPA